METRDEKTKSLKDALEELRRAADAVVERAIGSEAVGHLRQAARHGIAAARKALDEAERRCADKDKPAGDATNV